MNDYEYRELGEPAESEAGGGGGPSLPFGLSVQTVSIGLFAVALAAILYLFFGGTQYGDESVPGLPTPTQAPDRTRTASTAALRGPGTASPVATASRAAGSPPAPTPAATIPVGQSARTGITDGGFVRVQGTGGFGLRLRFGRGADYITIRIVDEGEVLRVVGGPEEAEGNRWWRLQDSSGHIGWAAETYLAATAAPATWSPPVASPTFAAGAQPLSATAVPSTP